MEFMNSPSSRIAAWQELVVDAENKIGYFFDETLESYLVFTLDQFTREENWTCKIIAIDYLKALQISGRLGIDKLRGIGDQCLLLSGLFPENAVKKNVSLTYFISIGRKAYSLIGVKSLPTEKDSELFYKLSDNFVGLMDVLHAMRHLNPKILH